jgi:MtN3 and saliva related transmembrane protein
VFSDVEYFYTSFGSPLPFVRGRRYRSQCARDYRISQSGRMIQSIIIPWIGICAAVLTSLSYIPQVQKAWPRGSTEDLSLHMLAVLTAGLLLWVGYGLLKADWVIVAANSVGALLSASVLVFKIRDLRSGR